MHAPGTHFVRVGILALLAAAGATGVAAQDDANGVQACIYPTGVDHTKVLDDRNILFFMHNHVTYRNTLLGTCPGLRAENHFVHGESKLRPLCKGDLINVLTYSFGTATLGASCWLGTFQSLSDDEVQELLAGAGSTHKNGDVTRRAIKVEPVEVRPAAQPQPGPAETPAQPSTGAEPATAEPPR